MGRKKACSFNLEAGFELKNCKLGTYNKVELFY